MFFHGCALFQLFWDERRITFKDADLHQLWQFLYRRSGMGKLEVLEVRGGECTGFLVCVSAQGDPVCVCVCLGCPAVVSCPNRNRIWRSNQSGVAASHHPCLPPMHTHALPLLQSTKRARFVRFKAGEEILSAAATKCTLMLLVEGLATYRMEDDKVCWAGLGRRERKGPPGLRGRHEGYA